MQNKLLSNDATSRNVKKRSCTRNGILARDTEKK